MSILPWSDLAVNATITECQHGGQPRALAGAGHALQGLVVGPVIPALDLKHNRGHPHHCPASWPDLAPVDQAAVFAEPPSVRGRRQPGAVHGRHVLVPLPLRLLGELGAEQETRAAGARPRARLGLGLKFGNHFVDFMRLLLSLLFWLMLNRSC